MISNIHLFIPLEITTHERDPSLIIVFTWILVLTNPLLLRRYWAGCRDWLCEITALRSSSHRWSESIFFHFSFSRILYPTHWFLGKRDVRFSLGLRILISADRFHSPSSLYMCVSYHFCSFSGMSLRAFVCVIFDSLKSSDMIPRVAIIVWISRSSSFVECPGKKFPLELEWRSIVMVLGTDEPSYLFFPLRFWQSDVRASFQDKARNLSRRVLLLLTAWLHCHVAQSISFMKFYSIRSLRSHEFHYLWFRIKLCEISNNVLTCSKFVFLIVRRFSS